MRRPVIFLFLSFAFGIVLEYLLRLEPFHFLLPAVIPAAVFPVFRLLDRRLEISFSFSLFTKRRQEAAVLVCLFLFAALLGSVYFYLAENQKDPLEASVGETCTVEGRVITVHRKGEDVWQMLITAQNTRKRLVQVKGAMEAPAEYIGKRIVVHGMVELPSERRNPGLFDYRLYLKTKGVRVILQSDARQVELRPEASSPFFTMTARVKYGFLNKLESVMKPEACGLLAGMLFGDKSLIGDDIYEMFQKNGVAHILSVSGIHVGIVYLFISRLLGKRKTKVFYLLTALMLVLYAALSEFSPSVVRAAVMICIHMFSKAAYRRYDFLSCTAAGALGMLLVNPFYLFNAGFQLSYMAVFCLAALLPWANRKIDRMQERVGNGLLTEGLRLLSPLFIIQFGMAPLTACLFNYFSIAAFFINIPIIAISGVIIPLGLCLMPLSFLPDAFPGRMMTGAGARAAEFVFETGAKFAELLTAVMLRLNELFFLPGIGFFNAVSPAASRMLMFYGFLFFLSSEFFRILYQRKRWRVITLCCGLILTLSLMAFLVPGADHRRAGLVFVDVGQGDCLHIRTPEGRNILIDGGGSLNYEVGKKILLPYLLKNGVKSVDLALVTHLHTDHYLGIAQLAGDMKVKRLGTYEANIFREQEILADTGLRKQDLLYLTGGDRIKIEKDVWIDVLYPEEKSAGEYAKLVLDEEDENRSSLFMKVYYKGLTVMMTGDVGMEGENEIMRLYLNDPEILDVDILKVGHHGSRFSTGDEFLDVVSPEIAVFQVGKNNFGHPHPSVIDKCAEKGIIIYRNDLDGAIIFIEEGHRWHTEALLRKNTHIKE